MEKTNDYSEISCNKILPRIISGQYLNEGDGNEYDYESL